MCLQPVGEKALAEHIAVPHAAVLEEDPVLDVARRRGEGLLGLGRDVGAKHLPDGHGHALTLPGLSGGPYKSPSCATTQITWPVLTDSPAAIERFVTTPRRCAVISFSIFIASTTQITWPSRTSSPSPTST